LLNTFLGLKSRSKSENKSELALVWRGGGSWPTKNYALLKIDQELSNKDL